MVLLKIEELYDSPESFFEDMFGRLGYGANRQEMGEALGVSPAMISKMFIRAGWGKFVRARNEYLKTHNINIAQRVAFEPTKKRTKQVPRRVYTPKVDFTQDTQSRPHRVTHGSPDNVDWLKLAEEAGLGIYSKPMC